MAPAGARAGGRAGVTKVLRSEAGRPVDDLLERRTEANRRFFEAEADRIARLCHRMAERFARRGRPGAPGRAPPPPADPPPPPGRVRPPGDRRETPPPPL